MDRITWKRAIRKRNRNAKIRNWLILIFMLTLLGFSGWRMYYATTPECAMESLTAALQHGDAVEIEKYSAPERIAENSFKDFLDVLVKQDDNINADTKKLREEYLNKISAPLIEAAANDTVSYIATGLWPQQSGKSLLKGRQLDVDYEYLLQRSLLKGIKFKGLGKPIKDGNGYTVDVYLVDSYTDTEATLKGKLEKNGDSWQLVSLDGYKDFLQKVVLLHRNQVSEYRTSTATLQNDATFVYSLHQKEFAKLVKTSNGQLSPSQQTNIANLIDKKIVPALEKQYKDLEAIEAKGYANCLKKLRLQSLALSMEGWKSYAKGIVMDDINEINHGRSCIKQVDDLEHRLQDLIYFRCTNRNPTVIP